LTALISHGTASITAAPTGTRARATGRVCTFWATSTGSSVHQESHEGIWITAPWAAARCKISHQTGKVRYGSPYTHKKPAMQAPSTATGSLSTR